MVSRQQVFGKLSIIILTGQQSKADRWEWITFTPWRGAAPCECTKIPGTIAVESLIGVHYSGTSQTSLLFNINLFRNFIRFELFNTSSC